MTVGVVGVGVVGLGRIGSAHALTLERQIAGAQVVAVMDEDRERATPIAAELDAAVAPTADELIRHPRVDAVLITAPASTHADLVLKVLENEKPVLCEKPLATSAADALRIVRAETALERRLVQVGFMRRFDAGYLEVKQAIDEGAIGEPLLAHMVHRNPQVPRTFTDEMVVSDSFVHEMDATRWLFGEEIISVRIMQGKPSPRSHAEFHDPQILVLETESAALSVVEGYLDSGFGYDIRCEIVGSAGTAEVTSPRLSRRTTTGVVSEIVQPSWIQRFADAYRIELQAWVDSVRSGMATGPSAWDGYAAAAVAASAIDGLRNLGARIEVPLADRPAQYRSSGNGS